ncbi:alpha-N-arabinofuranosidase [Pseudobacter ginsenosidimutans]|uniref:non-reducing end alpha-L-arabinofuranosidase n=1 Tax=Pseudobacter ginsenosidimutans TaxID=661488 RepID=A0A4Q7MUV1_9BACT|nr:alpha-L-arabinofuranosidase C-terminal domain-containing protein [Pseudobacter ginsenosidimutans]QEC40608.1 alpha-N-arabinofuranosidase [Pseudobacter ginsenosidimutans]RZS72675.1 alpha-N-arabinofuranosidase [Pseudobacter ginsenosidimutans]
MKKILAIATATTMFAGVSFSQNRITLDIAKARDTINKNIYGHFAEHLGHCIYDGIYVGADNQKIPNRNGIRLDIVEALKKLKTPVLRWPGGCFADTYHWKDAIGPREKRKAIENFTWGGVREDNSFGTHEFLELCEMINAEPYLAINMGSGTVQEAMEWVQYVNHPNGTSHLTDLRQQNGRSKPWNVKYWGIGNESWDCGGNMTAAYYVNEYKKYATLATSYNNSEGLYRIAVGPGTEDYSWTETVMREVPLKRLEGLSIHHYSVINWSAKGSATGFSEDEYFSTMEQAWRMERMVKKNSEVMDKYDPSKKVGLVVDEWGGWYEVEKGTNPAFLYQQNSMRDAMIAGLTLNIFNNHCDRVRMANLAQTVNVLQSVVLTKEEKLVLTPTYHVMEMYNVHQDALLLPLTISSSNYELNGKKIQAVSASASKDRNGAIHISLVNMDAGKAQEISIDLGSAAVKTVSGRILQSAQLQDHNSFENPEKVKPAEFRKAALKGKELSVNLPAFSVVVLELK